MRKGEGRKRTGWQGGCVCGSKEKESSLKVESLIKTRPLAQILEEWRLEALSRSNNPNHTLLPANSSLDDRENFILHLQQKVTRLEHSFNELAFKHLEICTILTQEIDRKNETCELLRRENADLNREMRTVIEDVRKIAGRIFEKDRARVEARRGSPFRLCVLRDNNKENMNPSNDKMTINVRSAGKKLSNHLPRTEHSNKRIKTLSEITFCGPTDLRFSDEENESAQKQHLIHQDYYFSQIPTCETTLPPKTHRKTLGSLFRQSKHKRSLFQDCRAVF